MLEHATSVKNQENNTEFLEHAIACKHNFDFNKAKISDFKNNSKESLSLEIIYIKFFPRRIAAPPTKHPFFFW